MTSTDSATDHQPEPWFGEAGSDPCPHGPEPKDDSPEWDVWYEVTSDRHTGSPQDVRICLDAPIGDYCPECSADHNEPVPWSLCDSRKPTP
ncbi:hypothetical protein [Streptomyces sp. NPDC058398]|uniref:hypothetical protein n=1 Tax=Streptomyces sp. NPDC058398 TaxID=3346479 RepID=UPI003650DC6C